MDRNKKKAETSIVGILDGYFETGTEGAVWSVYKDGCQGYEGLYTIRDGDRLRVWDPTTGRKVLDEVIKFDHKIGYQPFPMNPKFGQQVAFGMYVHGIQTGWDPDEWARLFFRKEGETVFRAELARKTSREIRDIVVKGSKQWIRSSRRSTTAPKKGE